MSHAIVAILLIRLDARAGEWTSVEDLAKHFSLRVDDVRDHLAYMEGLGMVRLQRSHGLVDQAQVNPEPACA